MNKLFKNDEGYIMTYTEVYFTVHNMAYKYFRDLGVKCTSLYEEATLTADGVMRQIELYGEYCYHGKRWKRFI